MTLKSELNVNLGRQAVLTPRTYHKTMRMVWEDGVKVSPRGLPTRELVGAQLYLRNPLDRLVPSRARKLNPGFLVAEWLSTLFGIDDLKFFTQVVSTYDRFSTDGVVADGVYGTRINFEHEGTGLSQLDAVVARLQADPDSRQAVVALYNGLDLFGGGGKNIPCTLTMQFMVRDGRLGLITTMRSNDVYLGLPYDMFNFTMLQELAAMRLGVAPGFYLHQAGSLHMYESDEPVMLAMEGDETRWPHLMTPMPVITEADLELLNYLAINLHTDNFYSAALGTGWSTAWAKDYLVTLAATLRSFIHRNDSAPDDSLQAFELVKDTTLRYLLRPWLYDAGVRSKRHYLADPVADVVS